MFVREESVVVGCSSCVCFVALGESDQLWRRYGGADFLRLQVRPAAYASFHAGQLIPSPTGWNVRKALCEQDRSRHGAPVAWEGLMEHAARNEP